MAERARIGLLLFAASAAFPQTPAVHIPRAPHPPRLADFLSGEGRPPGVPLSGFRQYQPGDGEPITEETTVWLSYDHENLYAVFVCRDRGQVRARLSRREDVESDDHVVLNLDTFHDHQRAYTFRANPLGVQEDSIFTEGQGSDTSFDTVWHTEGRLTEDGYVVSMAIPFQSLRFPRAPVQHWGIGLGRSISRNNEYATWPYITARKESYLEQLGHLEGLESISPGRNLQLIPYGMLTGASFRDEMRSAVHRRGELRAGLDAKAVWRDAIAFDATLNPDFSQVESDEPQVTVNQRYEVFFPEKRPFFLENAGFFETPVSAAGFYEPAISLFFSRRIVDPRFGARVTGKVGGWVLGAMASDDRAAGAGAKAGVLRLRRDFTGQSSAGLLVTSRDAGGTSNRVVSLDARLRLHSNWVLSGQVLHSVTRDRAATRAGRGLYGRLDHSGRHFRYFSRFLDLSPEFRAELGFLRRVDTRQMEHWGEYKWRPEAKRILSFGPGAAALLNWDHHGRLQDWIAGAGFDVELPRQTAFSIGRSDSFERYRGAGFRKDSTGASFSTEWLKWLGWRALYTAGRSVNYFPPARAAPSGARSADAQLSIVLRPGSHLRVSESYLYSRLASDGATILENHIWRSKVHYQFSTRLSLRGILDYNSVQGDPSRIAQESTRRLTADVLFTWLLHPGTAMYAGYTDRREDRERMGRQVFVKLSYLVRF